MTEIWKLEEGNPNMQRVAAYSTEPKKSMVCFIKQFLEDDYNVWNYPEIIKGMRESSTVPDRWYYDGDRCVYAAYPA